MPLPRRHPHSSRNLCALPVLLVVFTSIAAHAEQWQQLNPQGYVNDFAGVLNPSTVSEIDRLSTEVDTKAKAQIAVVTIKTLDGDPVEDFANHLFQKWGVGYKGTDRGVMILVATQDHKYWTEVGYGLEPILPDGKVGDFGRGMVPYLRQGDYNTALLKMTQQVAGVIAQDRHASIGGLANTPSHSFHQPLMFIFILLFMLFLFVMFFGIPIYLFMKFVVPFLSKAGTSAGGAAPGGVWSRPILGSGSSSRRSSEVFWGNSGGFSTGSGGGFGGFGGGSSGGGGAGGSW